MFVQRERQKSDPGCDTSRRGSNPAVDVTSVSDVTDKKGEASSAPTPTLKHSYSSPAIKSISFSPTVVSQKPQSPYNTKPALSSKSAKGKNSGGMKHSHSTSALSVSEENEDSAKRGGGREGGGGGGGVGLGGGGRKRMLSLSVDTRGRPVGGGTGGGGGNNGGGGGGEGELGLDEDDDPKARARLGRRATIAELTRPQPSNLPPHLLQRLEDFMNSTEAFLLEPSSPTARGREDEKDGRRDSPGDWSVSPRRELGEEGMKEATAEETPS